MRALSLLSVLICNGWLSLMVGNRIDAASAGASLKTSKRDGKVTEVIVIDAEFDRQYLSAVSNANETVYLFSIEPHHPEQISAVRINVYAENSSKSDMYPLLFMVKEQRSILSWQVPLILSHSYNNVSRTLCPSLDDEESKDKKVMAVEVSSMSPDPIKYTLSANRTNMAMLTDTMMTSTFSPSKPEYYLYTFPDDVDSVVVKAVSDDSRCMILSVQDTKCPVFDLVTDVQFTGVYQTVTKQGAISVQRDDFHNASFFIVLVLKTHDYECNGIETIATQADTQSRQKTVSIVVTKAASKSDYYTAICIAVGTLLVFYLIAGVICIIDYFKGKNKDAHTEIPQTDIEQRNEHGQTYEDENNETSERDCLVYRPLDNNSGSALQSPLNPEDRGYGAIEGTSSGSAGFVSGADLIKTNGIPHRIPPPDEIDNDSEIDDTDIDMLNDIHEEKDIFRMKTFLYVADLARKSRKSLVKKYSLYTWNLIPIAIFYGIPVIQLVITYQKVLRATGNQDICYYNFLCTHPLGVLSAFNNVFSNIGYVMLGILFLALVYRRDRMYRKQLEQNERLEKYYGIPQHFGLFYAMGIALIMEGVLSGCYHVCPSYSNYQFDTSFMYLTAWLLMLKIYQTRHPDINAHSHVAYFTLAIIIFVAVVGVLYDNFVFWIAFSMAYIVCALVISIHVYYMGRWKLNLGVFRRVYIMMIVDRVHCLRPVYVDRMILLVIGNLANLAFALYGLLEQPKDFSSYLLAIFMINLFMYFAFYIIMKLRSREKILFVPMMYIILGSAVWMAAIYFFLARLTSWQLTPAQSREHNKECLLFNFYDDHDVWHFLSATALFLSFMMLLTLDDDRNHVSRDSIPVF